MCMPNRACTGGLRIFERRRKRPNLLLESEVELDLGNIRRGI